MLGLTELERVVARAEREGLVDREGLATILHRFPGRPGTPALRKILASSGGPALTRSEAEQHFREMTLDGILAIQAGDNPRVFEEKLMAWAQCSRSGDSWRVTGSVVSPRPHTPQPRARGRGRLLGSGRETVVP